MARATAMIAKAGISVSEMARMIGLSRGHFHSLVRAGVFPMPVYCVSTKRPLYVAEQQQVCLQVRATNIGADGRFRLFYGERNGECPRPSAATRRTGAATASANAALIDGLKALGLATVSDQQVASALAVCFPVGMEGIDQGLVLRSLWQQIRRMDVA